MGNITSCMDSSTGVRLRFDDKLRAVAEYLHYREADPKLKIRLFNYFCTSWRRGSDLHDEQVILDDMPRQLKKLVYEHVSKAAESCVPMLKGLAAETIGQIFIKLKLVSFQVGEYMYHSGELGGDMYFLLSGVVLLSGGKGGVTKEQPIHSIYRPQDLRKQRKVERDSVEPYFGHCSLFEEVCKFVPQDAKAHSNVELLYLTRGALDTIREFCPVFYDRLLTFCQLSAARYGVAIAAHLHDEKITTTRGYPKIEQMCLDLRRELMGRHHQVLMGNRPENISATAAVAVREGALHEPADHLFNWDRFQLGASAALAVLECDILMSGKGLFAQVLPTVEEEKLSKNVWAKGYLSITRNLNIWYIIDEIENLLEPCPRCMGTFVIDKQNFQKSCQVWRQAKNEQSPDFRQSTSIPRFGCVFTVSGPGDGGKRIYIRCKTDKESVSAQNSMLGAASHRKQPEPHLSGSGTEILRAESGKHGDQAAPLSGASVQIMNNKLNEATHGPSHPVMCLNNYAEVHICNLYGQTAAI